MEAESRIAEVTLYARGARVRRVAELARVAPRVRITGLPAAVIDDTVRVEAEGAVVTAVHVGLAAPDAAAAAGEDAPEVGAARRSAVLAEVEVERLTAALTALGAAPVAPADRPAPQWPGGPNDGPPPAWDAVVDARRALVALRAARDLVLRDQIAAAQRTAEDARGALAAALDRDRRAGSARTARLHELRKHVDLEIEMEGSGGATVHLEYQVAAARWAPSYVARLDGERVVLELRAAIAQATGEDWTAARVRLSTAEPERFGALPELAAQRIGRRQPPPARAGFRAPPSGAAALYLDYLRSFPARPAKRAPGTAPPPAPPPGAPPPAPIELPLAMAMAMPMPARGRATPGAPPVPAQPMKAEARRSSAPQAFLAQAPAGARTLMGNMDGGGLAQLEAGSAESPAPAPPRLDYANLRMAPPGSGERGALVPAPRDPRLGALHGEIAVVVAQLDALALPAGCSTDWPHTYDYAFATDGTVDVRSDGGWHSIAVTAVPATVTLRHVAVPRVQPDVFRIAAIANPLAGPLLPGPIDVYDRGSFLVTSAVDHTPPGGRVEIGLGVDPQVKLARNTEFSEETTGVLRGGLRLHHRFTVDIDNLSDRAIDIEVRERLPVTREDDHDITVTLARAEPAWERWAPDPDAPGDPRLRGGHRWRLAIPARTKRTMWAAYEVKIAGKLELIGGNRREP